MSESEEDSEPVFEENPETDPPTPVAAKGIILNGADDLDAIPNDLVDDEHVAKVNRTWIMRSDFECSRCGSNVWLHPRSIKPRNSLYCYNCSHAPAQLAWWETPRLESFGGGED